MDHTLLAALHKGFTTLELKLAYNRSRLRSQKYRHQEQTILPVNKAVSDHPFFPSGNVIIQFHNINCQKLSIPIVIVSSGNLMLR